MPAPLSPPARVSGPGAGGPISALRAAVAALAALPRRTLARLCLLSVLCIWVSFILVARGSARGSLTPVDIAWLRFVFSGLLALPLAWAFRAELIAGLARGATGAADATSDAPLAAATERAVALRRALVLGLVGGVGYSLLTYSGFFLAPVSHAVVLLPGSLPLWSALAAWWLLNERLTPARLAGLGLIVAGGVAVAGVGSGEALGEALGKEGTWRGDLLFVAASITWALYGVLCRRWRVGAIEATAAVAVVSLLLGAPACAALWLTGALPTALPVAPWRELAFQAVYQGGLAMLVAGMAFTQVVAHYGPVRTTMFTATVPPLAALAAVPVLGEPLAASALLGLVCVTLGLLVGAGVVAWPKRVVGAVK